MICTMDDGTEVQERSTDVRAYISPSRLNTWLKCPVAFKMRYIEGIRSRTTPSLFLGKAIHAGLECGIIGQQIPDMDMVSFGPLLENPHSPAEQLQIDSVEKFWKLMAETLRLLAEA